MNSWTGVAASIERGIKQAEDPRHRMRRKSHEDGPLELRAQRGKALRAAAAVAEGILNLDPLG